MPLSPEQPLYVHKADLFKALGHPVRVRALELLSDGELPVSDLLVATGIEASHLSQHLGVLRNAGVVTARRAGKSVYYRLEHPGLAQMLVAARSVLSDRLSRTREALSELDSGAGK